VSSDEVRDLLARSRTELDAARALSERGFSAQAVGHAYYAAFYSAEGALLAASETRSKHSGVVSAFGRIAVKEGGFDATIGAILRKLFDLRHSATYDDLKVAPDTARSAIADAERFVGAVDRWLARRP
jgi:uncharacterized protein (UPF0332 family)